MMIVEIPYRSAIRECTLFDLWDIEEDQIVIPKDALSEDAGKYLIYTDGSRMLTKLLYKRGLYLNTRAGLFYSRDYVNICRPKPMFTGYSGLYLQHEHTKFRKPTLKEKQRAEDFTKKKLPSNQVLTKRVALLVLEKLQDKMKVLDIDENWIVSKLKKEAENPKNRGADRLTAITMLGRIGGVEMGSSANKSGKPTALFAQFNNFTIQDKRRQQSLPTRKVLEEIIDTVGEAEEELALPVQAI